MRAQVVLGVVGQIRPKLCFNLVDRRQLGF
jgi:hypothetical protein